MIISHKHNFIFIKTAKTAGSSIEAYLSPFCGESDIVTPFIRISLLFFSQNLILYPISDQLLSL